MNTKEVQRMIGRDNWQDFLNFMSGQTVGIDPNGETNYYTWDVETYCNRKGIKY